MRWFDLIPFVGFDGVDDPLVFTAVVAVSTLVDAYLVHRLLFAPGSIGFGRCLASVLGLAAIFLAKAFALRTVGLISAFGFLTLLWYLLLITLPSVSVRLLAVRRDRTIGAMLLTLAFFPLLFWPIAGYARWIEPFRLQVEERVITVPENRRGTDPLRVVVVADIQTDRITDYSSLRRWHALLLDRRRQ